MLLLGAGCESLYVPVEQRPAPREKKPAPAPGPRLVGPEQPVTVKQVHGGDLIELADGRQVRYLGVLAPAGGERWFVESRDANRSLVQGRQVLLRYARPQKTQAGELLAYVLVPATVRGKQGYVIANLNMVRSGSARASTATRHYYRGAFLRAEMLAREEKLGIWRD